MSADRIQTGYESLSADQLRSAIAETRIKPRGKRGNLPMLLRERNRRTRATRKAITERQA